MSKDQTIALITGASSGLGREYCKQLARHYKTMLVVARREERLKELSHELADLGVETQCIEADLATDAGLNHLLTTIQNVGHIDLLINNAGFGTFGSFASQTLSTQFSMLHLHINAVVALCHAVIPFMKARGNGTIINVASMAAYVVMPNVSVYGASKRFIVYFSEALQEEIRDFGIKIQCLSPGYVQTEFFNAECWHKYADENISADNCQSPAQVVLESLTALSTDSVHVVPGIHNRKFLETEFGIVI